MTATILADRPTFSMPMAVPMLEPMQPLVSMAFSGG